MKRESFISVTAKFSAETEKEAKAKYKAAKDAIKAVAVEGVKLVVK